jgi:hypothetical protein
MEVEFIHESVYSSLRTGGKGAVVKTGIPLLLLLSLFAAGCDDGGTTPTPTTTTTTTAGPTAGVFALDVVNAGLISSEASGNLFGVELRIRESAGLGGNINFIRLDYFRATGGLEGRAEIGANDIISELGTNRIAANATWQEVAVFFFRASIKRGRQLLVTVSITDDRGNNVELTESFVIS